MYFNEYLTGLDWMKIIEKIKSKYRDWKKKREIKKKLKKLREEDPFIYD